MKIALLVPTLSKGGAERVASLLSLSLYRRYGDLFLIVFSAEDAVYDYDGSLIDLKIRDIGDRGFLRRLKNTFLSTIKLRMLKKKLNIDMLVSFLELSNIPNVLSGVSKTIISVREDRMSSKARNFQRKVADSLIRLIYNRAHRIVAVSRGVRESLIRDFGLASSRIITIYNPIDLDVISRKMGEEIEEELKDIFSHPVLITAGRLSLQKGQWSLIRTFARARNEIKDLRLVILGEGELRQSLEDLVKRLGIKEAVHFLGFRNNPCKYFAKSSLFVFPSLWEGFPNALLEAMACGLPVISSDCKSGPREILAPDTGFHCAASAVEHAEHGTLVPLGDGKFIGAEEPLSREEHMLADAILEILKSEKLRNKYSASGRRRAEDFSLGKITEDWFQVIDEVGS